jgi:hypothetical protein
MQALSLSTPQLRKDAKTTKTLAEEQRQKHEYQEKKSYHNYQLDKCPNANFLLPPPPKQNHQNAKYGDCHNGKKQVQEEHHQSVVLGCKFLVCLKFEGDKAQRYDDNSAERRN